MLGQVMAEEALGTGAPAPAPAPTPASADDVAAASALKEKGNAAFAAKDYSAAAALYSQALTLDATNHILYSNRSVSSSHAALHSALSSPNHHSI